MSPNLARTRLDQLLALDASFSLSFGLFSVFTPHYFMKWLAGGVYDHNVHETLRLYGCLRMACGWILWHVRKVDDGMFRKHVCEALLVCYLLQALSVFRAQFTDRHTAINWIALLILSALSFAYGSFRFGQGGNLIKVYELPTAGTLA
mmetsp:Transcript_13388/g.36921  ORF Transcript_13388/g.36921 Transcript_13388/m.36921 type:complete len:148 (-) Transcript_13388:2596-3039(-)